MNTNGWAHDGVAWALIQKFIYKLLHAQKYLLMLVHVIRDLTTFVVTYLDAKKLS